MIVPVGRFGVGVFNVRGRFYALTNYCPHRGAPLCEGTVTGTTVAGDAPFEVRWARDGEIVRCPRHQWEFELETGEAMALKGTEYACRIRTYPVSVRDGMIVLEGVS